MSGILDSKVRIISSVITQEGKRQMSSGGLRPVFATVSDRHCFYESDPVSGSSDATRRIYFEPSIENINDSIIMENDDSGGLLGYPIQGAEHFSDSGVITSRESIGSEVTYRPITTESSFASLAESIVESATERFKNLQSIGTREVSESQNLRMEITPKSHSFTINNKFPWSDGVLSAIQNLDFVEPLFFDEMLANSINFQYLPPVKTELSNAEKKSLELRGRVPNNKGFGSYVKFHRPRPMSLEAIMRHLNIHSDRDQRETPLADPDDAEDNSKDGQRGEYDARKKHVYKGEAKNYDKNSDAGRNHSEYKAGKENSNPGLERSNKNPTEVNLTAEDLARERVSIFFKETSSTNNIFMQMFEFNSAGSSLKKLDVIHYKTFATPENSYHPTTDVFFAGKIFINTIGLPVFVNLFTIIVD